MVPVTNLFFRLARSGPGYARGFSTQPGFQGLPHEKVQTYIDRSPVFRAANLKVRPLEASRFRCRASPGFARARNRVLRP